MQLVDQKARDEIMTDLGNIVVSASAGSGKTTIMIKKLKKTLENIEDHKTVAAVTFTNKATEEIKEKARKEGVQKDFIALTNDSFIEYEIIRPFITDTYGEKYKNDFTIDYDHKFSDFASGKKSIVSQGKLGVFNNIKENFKFRLALDILKRNIAARQYLQSKYKMIFLDEYQDSDFDMHNLFMYLKNNLHIKLFIVGDSKQAIYLWRGAQKNIFELLKQDDMNHYELIKNFRSHDEIVNYANLLHNTESYNKHYNTKVNHVILCKTKKFISSFTKMVRSGEINLDKEITIIININREAQLCTKRLNQEGYNFLFIPKTPIDDNTPNSHILHQIACYILDKNYSIYDLIDKINVDSRKQMVIRIENILENIIKNIDNKEYIQDTLLKLGELLEIDFTEDELQLLYETLQDKKFHSAFIKTDDKHKVMTVFASKGLEFNQVISFSNYYNLYRGRDLQNHYVCITRAEDKFIMVDNSNWYEEYVVGELYKHSDGNPRFLYKKVDHKI